MNYAERALEWVKSHYSPDEWDEYCDEERVRIVAETAMRHRDRWQKAERWQWAAFGAGIAIGAFIVWILCETPGLS